MYITQTYLGFSSGSALVYVYFLSETYMSERQAHLHQEFLSRVKEFGLSTGPEVAVLLPIPGYEESVLGDLAVHVNTPLQKFYAQNIRDHLPGLLVTRHPLDETKELNSAVFIAFNETSHPFREAKKLIGEMLRESNKNSLINALKKFNGFFVLQPNIIGVGLNINAILEALINTLKSK